MTTWILKAHPPSAAGWYYTRSHENGHTSSRYFDDSDGSWWNATARGGFTPNHSFDQWLHVPMIHGPKSAPGRLPDYNII